ncbi:MAG: hypothetical protein JXR95_01500 [Deltaproteobacteria bacterium]|nr:hypothetical protein [Deltaproteobacteria bacterium]
MIKNLAGILIASMYLGSASMAQTLPGEPGAKPATTVNDDVSRGIKNTGYKNNKKEKSRVKISGEFHGNWNMDLRNEENGGNDIKESTFNVTRVYLTAKTKLSSWLSARSTLDFGNYMGDIEQADHDPLLGYIKYAYFKTLLTENHSIVFGQQPRVWVGTMDKTMSYRYVMKSSMDHFGLFPSADTGVTWNGKFIGGIVDITAGIFNGNGYKDPAPGEEIISNLFETRITIKPVADKKHIFSKLAVHLYFGTDGYQLDDGTVTEDFRRFVFGGALGFNHPMVDALVEFMMIKNGQDGDKGSMVISPYLALKYRNLALFGTYGIFTDSNRDTDDTWTRLVAGISWTPCKKLALAINYQMESNTKFGGDGSNKSALFLSTFFKY